MLANLKAADNAAPVGIHTIREGRLTITPVFAKHVLEHLNYSGQRPISPQHVAFLAEHMRRGTFRPGSQIALARVDGKLTLTNGQHRLMAVAESGRAIEFQILIEDLDTPEQLASAYYTFDRGGRARSDADVLASVGILEKYDIPAHVARAAYQAYPLLMDGFRRQSYQNDPTVRNDDLRVAGLASWWPHAKAFYESSRGAPRWAKKRLYTAQAIAAGMVTFKYQPTAAAAFWSGLAEDDGLVKGDPRKALLNDMATRLWRRQSDDGPQVIAAAWSAYFEGRQLSHIRINADSKLRFAGTPIGRGR